MEVSESNPNMTNQLNSQFKLEDMPVPALVVDRNACVVEFNSLFCQAATNAVRQGDELSAFLMKENGSPVTKRSLKPYSPDTPLRVVLQNQSNLMCHHVELAIKKLNNNFGDYWLIVVYPIDDMMNEIQNLRLAASLDELTGIYNRRAFHAKFDKELKRARRYDTMMALLLIDFDHFKQVNDTFGHQKGDALLKSFAEHISGVLRECDTFARLGGDEFAILMPETTLDQANQAANRIREISQEAFSLIEVDSIPLSICVGIAATHGKFANKNALIHLADEALYNAKDSGRNNVKVRTLTAA